MAPSIAYCAHRRAVFFVALGALYCGQAAGAEAAARGAERVRDAAIHESVWARMASCTDNNRWFQFIGVRDDKQGAGLGGATVDASRASATVGPRPFERARYAAGTR